MSQEEIVRQTKLTGLEISWIITTVGEWSRRLKHRKVWSSLRSQQIEKANEEAEGEADLID